MKSGLSQQEVEKRRQNGQVNCSPEHLTRTYQEIVRSNILTYFNLINTVLLILVLITGQFSNGLFYVTIVFNALIGIAQECKAKQMLDRLSLLVKADAEVCRDGQWQTIKADQLVLGDHVRMKSGMQIPADAVVTDGYLEVNESILTGESRTLIKQSGDRLFAGTLITSGQAETDLIHVGKENYSETIMKDARRYKRARSLLHDDLNRLLRVVSVLILPTGIGLFCMQYFTLHLSWQSAVLKTIAAMVGMIPEGLVVLTSVALAVSVIRLSRRQVLVQDLYSIESLARVDVLCVDKTGTLTQGTMQVQEVVPLADADLNHIKNIMGSYVQVFPNGNATDTALQAYFAGNQKYAAVDSLPFSSDRKYAAVSLKEEGTFYLGAANFLFPQAKTAYRDQLNTLTSQGCRVVILAHSAQESISRSGLPDDLEAIALIAMQDVLRPNVQKIMQYFREQGVTLKVISGDDPATVSALAAKAGIAHAEQYVDMTTQRFRDPASFVDSCTVFGRVLPDQKKAMVRALQQKGHVVAMVGDGVNDVPALKTADVSIAMAAGSSAAKNSSNIVLLSNDFGLLPDIVNEGRRVINNISRASSMYLVKTVFSLLLSLFAVLLKQSYPFLPIHLTLISTFGVGIPTFLLQMESDFSRVHGRFFSRSFRNAVPSAIAVLLCAMLSRWLANLFGLEAVRSNAILVSLTAYIYLYTLYRIYYPLNRYRTIVLSSMAVCILVSLILFAGILEVSFGWLDLLVIGPALFVLPVLIAALSRVYDWFAGVFRHLHHGKETKEAC